LLLSTSFLSIPQLSVMNQFENHLPDCATVGLVSRHKMPYNKIDEFYVTARCAAGWEGLLWERSLL
ncbi:MAG: hypothetical protein Q4C10_15660, partial [Clostridia bacterium]|nr:hypothetical protein [Clostridia bacterium]